MNHDELQNKLNLIPEQNLNAWTAVMTAVSRPDQSPYGAQRTSILAFDPNLGLCRRFEVDPSKLHEVQAIVNKQILGVDLYAQWLPDRVVRIPSFNSLTSPQAFKVLQSIESLALILDIAWSMNYNNGSNTWYFTLSGGGIEDWMGKDYSLSTAMELTLEQMFDFYHRSVMSVSQEYKLAP